MLRLDILDRTLIKEDAGEYYVEMTITDDILSQYPMMARKLEEMREEREQALYTVHSPNGTEHLGSSGSVRQVGNPTEKAATFRLALEAAIAELENRRTLVVLATELWLMNLEREDAELAAIMRQRYTAAKAKDRQYSRIEHDIYGTYGEGDVIRMRIKRYWKKYPEGLTVKVKISNNVQTMPQRCSVTFGLDAIE